MVEGIARAVGYTGSMFAPLLLVLAAAPTVSEANAAGMKLYQARRYLEASQQFAEALKDEAPRETVQEKVAWTRTRALAHFNLACSLSLLRKAGRVCDGDAYRSVIVSNVEQSIALDPNRLEKALKDPDLSPVRDTVAWQSLLGLSMAREADLKKLLPRVTWWSPGVGVFGSLHQLTFTADGRFTLTSKVFDADGVPKGTARHTGTWALEGRALRLTTGTTPLPGAKSTSLELTVEPGGRLTGRDWTDFTDAPSECDA